MTYKTPIMEPIQAVEGAIIATFEALSTVDEKYALLFQLAEELPPMDPALKTEDNLVRGCQSKLWFHLSQEAGRFHLQADSDSQVIKGIAALLARLVQGHKAEEIQAISLDFVDQIKIWKLPSERNNGLMAMLAHLHTRVRDPQAPRAGGSQHVPDQEQT